MSGCQAGLLQDRQYQAVNCGVRGKEAWEASRDRLPSLCAPPRAAKEPLQQPWGVRGPRLSEMCRCSIIYRGDASSPVYDIPKWERLSIEHYGNSCKKSTEIPIYRDAEDSTQ